MRSRNESGSVSASTRPPRSAAMSPPVSWCCTLSQFCVYTCNRFQLSGRLAAALMSLISSNVSRVNSPTWGMNSSVVPGNSPTTRHSATSSSRRRVARRDRDARVVVVRRRPRRREPHATGCDARRRSSALHRVELRGSRRTSPIASSCITTRRSAEWPTRNPAFGMSVPSSRSRYCRSYVQSHGTPCCERLQRHALDAGEHPHQVVAVLVGRERRDREAAVAAHHRRHAVQRRRAQRRCPRTPARRSGCGCR